MPAAQKTAKSSLEFLPSVKKRLGELKLELRFRGVKHCSESEIVAHLIEQAKIDELEQYFRKRMRDRERQAKSVALKRG